MNRTRFSLFLTSSLLLALAGCSGSGEPAAKKEAPPKKAVEPVSGQSAIFQMFQVARTWANDATLLKVENMDIPEAKAQPGKYGAWRATFVSTTRKVRRDYTYSVSDSEGGLIKGARAGQETMYARNPQIFPIAIQDVKTDTTVALETALKNKEIKDLADKNPTDPVQFILEWTNQTPNPAWRVYWGPTLSTSKGSAYIDAKDGKFIRKAR